MPITGGDSGGNHDKARMVLSANQGVSSGAWRKVNLDTVDWDTAGLCDTAGQRIVIQRSGYYMVFAFVRTTTAVGSDVAVRRNGSIGLGSYGGSSSTRQTKGGGFSLYCDAGDYLELYCFPNAGGTLDSSIYATHLDVVGPF